MIHSLWIHLHHPLHFPFPHIDLRHIPLAIGNKRKHPHHSLNHTTIVICDTSGHFPHVDWVAVDDVVGGADRPQADILVADGDQAGLEGLGVH